MVLVTEVVVVKVVEVVDMVLVTDVVAVKVVVGSVTVALTW